MDNGQTSHGVNPTSQIAAADNPGGAAAQGANPAAQPGAQPGIQAGAQPGIDPTQNGRTLPIGGADGAQPQVYKPQGIAEHLLGQTDQETIDKLQKAYTGAREEIAKGKPAIPKPEEYKWNWSDGIKGQIGADDPALKEFSAIASEHGFSQQQIDAIPKFFDKLAEKGIIEKPFDASALLADLAPAGYKGSPEERQAEGGKRLTRAEGWIKQLSPQAGFDDAMKNEMRLMTTSVAGIKVIEKLMNGGVNPSVSPGGQQQQAAVTKSDVERRVADPRNNAFDPKYDEAFAQETREMFKRLYPG